MAISKVTSGGIADGTLSVEDIADDAVTAAKLANSINTDIATGVTGNTTANAALPKAGGTMTGDLILNDNVKLEVGSATGGDLQIYHSGSHSFIDDTGTGTLRIRGSDIQLEKYTGENMLVANSDGAVTLYHNALAKFETTATGAKITQSGTDAGLLVTGGGYNFQAKFESTDAEANIIIEDSNSTTDANRLGVVTNDMYFVTNNTERMRIDSTGRVTMPYQPSFRAYSAQNTFTLAANTTYPFNATEHNTGNCFNTSTKTFTAPIAGTYFFHFYTIFQSGVTNGHISFLMSGSSISKGKAVHFSKTHTGWSNVHHSGVFKLSTGTTVNVHNSSNAQNFHGNSWSSFSGYLIG